MNRCPRCGARVERVRVEDGGAVEQLIWDVTRACVRRAVRPATFFACMTCEWCAESERGQQ